MAWNPMGNPLFALGANLYGAQNWNKGYGQYRADVDEDFAKAEGILTGMRRDVTTPAWQLGNLGQGLIHGYYGGGAPLQRFQGAFDPIQAGYQQLPGQIAGQTQDIVGGYGARAGQIGGAFQQGAGALEQGYGARAGDIGAAYGQRTQAGMNMLQGAGEQARADINQRYNQLGAQQAAAMQARGLGSTTIGGAQQAALQRERGGELGRLGESLRQQQLSTYTGLSGEELLARQGLTGQALAAQGQNLMYGTGLQAGLTGETLAAQQAGQALGANVNLASLGAQGDIAGYGLGYQDQAMRDRMASLATFGQIPLQYGMGAGQMGLNFYGNINRYPPQPYQSAPIYAG